MKRLLAFAILSLASHLCFAQSAKQDLKDAGKDIGRGTKKAGKTIGRETKKSRQSRGQGVQEGCENSEAFY